MMTDGMELAAKHLSDHQTYTTCGDTDHSGVRYVTLPLYLPMSPEAFHNLLSQGLIYFTSNLLVSCAHRVTIIHLREV